MTTQLSPHFTLEEMILSQTAARMGDPNMPDQDAYDNLELLCAVLERVRILLGNKPVLISSGYRSEEVNAECGGSPTSAHMFGLAADFTCPGYGSPKDICLCLEPHLKTLMVDQLIHEYGSWVHLAISEGDPRYECLTIDTGGTSTGFA